MLGFLPFILFALPAGVWVDRLRRRPILIAGDAARAVLLVYIPVAWALGVLDIWQLMALQFAIGIFTVFFDIAYQSYLPALVDREQLVEGNSKLQTTASAAQIGGPGLAGVLIGVLTAPYAIAFDAASFVLSTAFMLPIRKPEHLPERGEGEPRPKMLPELKEGVAYVVRHRHLKWIAVCTGPSLISFTRPFSSNQTCSGRFRLAGRSGRYCLKMKPLYWKSTHIKEHGGPKGAPVGEGTIDWKPLFEAYETVGGTEWYIVEHETGEVPLESVKKCIDNMHKMGK